MSNIGNKETMSNNLQFYIKQSGRSQKELAEMVGVAYSTFNDWVKGKKYPRIDKIEMLANFFRIQKSDLIEEKNTVAEIDNSMSKAKRQLIDFAKNCTDEQAKQVLKVLEMMKKGL